MPIKFDFSSDEEFIDYFIYFYEYTFPVVENEILEDFNIRKELISILSHKPYTNYKDLWIYCYLKINIKLTEVEPIDFLKDTMEKMVKNFTLTNPIILEIQLELLRDIFTRNYLVVLQARPYEQLKKSPVYGSMLLNKENELIKLFQDYKDSFSDIKINKCTYIKLKDRKFISKEQLILELYSMTLFELCEKEEFPKNEEITKAIKDFVSLLTKGKLNYGLVSQLSVFTQDFLKNYVKKQKVLENKS